MREKIHYLKFCMSCSAGQAGHLASPLVFGCPHLKVIPSPVTLVTLLFILVSQKPWNCHITCVTVEAHINFTFKRGGGGGGILPQKHFPARVQGHIYRTYLTPDQSHKDLIYSSNELTCAVQILLVALSFRMCCSLV